MCERTEMHKPQIEHNNKIHGMDLDQARDVAHHANLPFILRDLQENGGLSEDEAKEKLVSLAKEEGIGLKIVSVGESTAFIAANAETNEITVSFDPCMFGENIKFWPEEHDLGGKVFSGVEHALLSEDESGIFMDQVRDGVVEAAEKLEGNVELRMTGMSKGAAMAVSSTGHWISEGFFREHPEIALKSIHTFGTSPCGNGDFKEAFEAKIAQMEGVTGSKIGVWRITADPENDSVPTMLTADSPWYKKPLFMDDYEHVGTEIRLKGVAEHDMGSYLEGMYTSQHIGVDISPSEVLSVNYPEEAPPQPPGLGI